MSPTPAAIRTAAALAIVGYWFVYAITAAPTTALVGGVSTGCLTLLVASLAATFVHHYDATEARYRTQLLADLNHDPNRGHR